MTAIGARKHNATGRSVGQRKMNDRMRIIGQFVPRPAAMLSSPAFRTLSLSAHRVLGRVEVEHCMHGGMDNGMLPVTFQNFEDYGIDRKSIGPAIAECVALGFLSITEKGRAGNGEWRKSNKFRLTYIAMRGVQPSNDWNKIETDAEAERLAREARKPARSKARSRWIAASLTSPQNIDSGGLSLSRTVSLSSGENPPSGAFDGGLNTTENREKPPRAFGFQRWPG